MISAFVFLWMKAECVMVLSQANDFSLCTKYKMCKVETNKRKNIENGHRKNIVLRNNPGYIL